MKRSRNIKHPILIHPTHLVYVTIDCLTYGVEVGKSTAIISMYFFFKLLLLAFDIFFLQTNMILFAYYLNYHLFNNNKYYFSLI